MADTLLVELADVYPEGTVPGRRDPNPFADARDVRGVESLSRRIARIFEKLSSVQHVLVHWAPPDGVALGFAIDRAFSVAPRVRRIDRAALARHMARAQPFVLDPVVMPA